MTAEPQILIFQDRSGPLDGPLERLQRLGRCVLLEESKSGFLLREHERRLLFLERVGRHGHGRSIALFIHAARPVQVIGGAFQIGTKQQDPALEFFDGLLKAPLPKLAHRELGDFLVQPRLLIVGRGAFDGHFLHTQKLFVLGRIELGEDIAILDDRSFRNHAEQDRGAVGREPLAADADGDVFEPTLDDGSFTALNPATGDPNREKVGAANAGRQVPFGGRLENVHLSPAESACHRGRQQYADDRDPDQTTALARFYRSIHERLITSARAEWRTPHSGFAASIYVFVNPWRGKRDRTMRPASIRT